MRASLLFLFSSCVLAVAGCYASDGRAIVPAGSELACAPDELELAWASPDDEWSGVYHPVSLDVAPGGALLARGTGFGAQIVRASDGTTVTGVASARVDERWQRVIEVDGETGAAIVRELASGEVVRTIERPALGEGWYGNVTAWLEGDRALLLECDEHPATEEARAIVRSVDLASGAERSVTLPVVCGPTWSIGASRVHALSPDAAIVVGVREPGPAFDEGGAVPALGIARVDFASGTAITAFPGDPTIVAPLEGPFPHVGAPDLGIVSSAVSASEIAIVSRDGVLRRLDAETLAPVADPIAVPLLAANWDTYLPSAESPVAYSAGGTLLAHVTSVRTIAIRDVATGTIVSTLELPFEARADGGVPPPMAIRFVPDGVIVSASHGLARYACGGEVAPIARPAGELAVRASGPASVRVGEPVTYRIEVENATLPVVRHVTIEGTGSVLGSLGPEVLAYTSSPGTVSVSIVADDGTRSATTSVRLDIAPE